jgi:fructose-specific phosphotransferase system IIC component
MADDAKNLEQVILTRVVRLNAKIQGIVTGFLAGLGLFIATNWLVLKGGKLVGKHLSLLGQLFIGYQVTLLGSFIGFAYAFVCGFVVGYSVAWMYNWIADRKESRNSGLK